MCECRFIFFFCVKVHSFPNSTANVCLQGALNNDPTRCSQQKEKMEEKFNITAGNREQIVNLNRKLGLTSACQRRPLLSVPRPGPTSLPRHVFFPGSLPSCCYCGHNG